MLLWINGAHGAGKTTVAKRLRALRPGATIVDPEQVGFLLRKLVLDDGIADFKDLPAWRAMVLAMLRELAGERPERLLIVPMTLSDHAHFDEIVGGLREAGVALQHVTLTAAPATLRRRLRRRLDWPSSRRWALARVDACQAAFADARFGVHVATDGRQVDEVAREILHLIGG